MSRSLCNEHEDDEGEDSKNKPWYAHRKWLDYSARLQEAHSMDEERQTAVRFHVIVICNFLQRESVDIFVHWPQFHVAVQQLRQKSAEHNEATKEARHQLELNHTHIEDLNSRWQRERDAANYTVQREKEQRDVDRARTTAQYCEFEKAARRAADLAPS